MGFRGGAVDFVGEDDVCEQRSGLENELAAAVDLLEDGVSRDIAGQEVRGELDALVLQAEELGKAFHEFGFA